MAMLTDQQTANVERFRRLIDEGFNRGITATVDEICGEGLIEHQDGFDPPNREGVKGAITFLHALAPDFQLTVEAIDAIEDRVWARLRGQGTHTGPVLGGPTGRRFDIAVMDLARFEDEVLVEHWGVPDRFAQMLQLGLLRLGPEGTQAAAEAP